MLQRIYAIGINTFREAVRDRVLYGVMGFASLVLLFTLALAELALNEQARVVLDVGLASISLFSVLVAIFLGSSLLYKEIERKTLYVILPKPIRRWEFLLGKFVGIVLTGFVFIALMGTIQLFVTAVQADVSAFRAVLVGGALLVVLVVALRFARDRTAVLLPWSALCLAGGFIVCQPVDVAEGVIAGALLLNACEVMVLASVALLFSSFSTPFLTGVFSFGVWLLGRAADDMATMKGNVLSPPIKRLLHGLAEVVPNFNLFVPGRHTLSEMTPEWGGPWAYVLRASGYGVLYAGLTLALAMLIFRKRDFL